MTLSVAPGNTLLNVSVGEEATKPPAPGVPTISSASCPAVVCCNVNGALE